MQHACYKFSMQGACICMCFFCGHFKKNKKGKWHCLVKATTPYQSYMHIKRHVQKQNAIKCAIKYNTTLLLLKYTLHAFVMQIKTMNTSQYVPQNKPHMYAWNLGMRCQDYKEISGVHPTLISVTPCNYQRNLSAMLSMLHTILAKCCMGTGYLYSLVHGWNWAFTWGELGIYMRGADGSWAVTWGERGIYIGSG